MNTAQRRPGRESRRHATWRSCPRRSATLNEGRDVNPGDTSSAGLGTVTSWIGAQRRPGRESRRHPPQGRLFDR